MNTTRKRAHAALLFTVGCATSCVGFAWVVGCGSQGESPASEAGTESVPSASVPIGNDEAPPAVVEPDQPGPVDLEPMPTSVVPSVDPTAPTQVDTPVEPEDVATPTPTELPEAPSEGACTVDVQAEVSTAIATVGIVTFETSLAAPSEAHIEFGLDTSYGMTAPVDLGEPSYRTLLLGMKQARDYHFRVVVTNASEACASEDQIITTGTLPNVLPALDVTNFGSEEQLTGGYLLTGQYQAMGGDASPAYIIDVDGDYVWAALVGDYVTGVRMSYDGKWMWINGTDNTTGGAANIHRLSMDGLIDEDLSEAFGIQDHSMTVLPDESVIFYGHETECADIKRRYPDGTIESIVNSRDAHGAPGPCHINAIEYSPDDETLIFSDDMHDNYTKITLDGEVVWVLGGETSDFTGDAAQWSREHGIDALSTTRLVYFNNQEPRDPEGSVARELELDLVNMTATQVWSYLPDPPIANEVLGDVQRMDNGNTIIGFSAQGLLHEVDAEGNLLQEISWPLGGAFGYLVKRLTLYGPSPR